MPHGDQIASWLMLAMKHVAKRETELIADQVQEVLQELETHYRKKIVYSCLLDS